MALTHRKVLLLAADEFEDMELLYPLYRLREEDVAVTVAGLDGHPVTGKKGHGPVPVDTTVGQVTADDFDALAIPGGYAPDKLRRSQAVLALVRAFDDATSRSPLSAMPAGCRSQRRSSKAAARPA
jgi:protease I